MTLPAPPIPYDLDLRSYNLPMPIDAWAVRAWEWVLLPDVVKAARLQLMTWAWTNNPTGSLHNSSRMHNLVGIHPRSWKRLAPQVTADFVLCSDDRFYHPFLVEQAKLAWAQIKAIRARSKDGRLNVRSHEWKVLRAGIFARDDYTCHYCGKRGDKLECDHVIPVSRGGSNDPGNLVTACKPCNRSKGAKPLEEWLQ